jgi:ABC-type glutathione transport system ATPase component
MEVKRVEDLLKVSELSLYVKEYNREKKILDSLNFEIFSSEIVAVVGESGCGKTMLARTLLRLNSERIFRAEGDILFENTSVMKLSDRQILAIRGRKIGFVFQEPISYLNPTMKKGIRYPKCRLNILE